MNNLLNHGLQFQKIFKSSILCYCKLFFLKNIIFLSKHIQHTKNFNPNMMPLIQVAFNMCTNMFLPLLHSMSGHFLFLQIIHTKTLNYITEIGQNLCFYRLHMLPPPFDRDVLVASLLWLLSLSSCFIRILSNHWFFYVYSILFSSINLSHAYSSSYFFCVHLKKLFRVSLRFGFFNQIKKSLKNYNLFSFVSLRQKNGTMIALNTRWSSRFHSGISIACK